MNFKDALRYAAKALALGLFAILIPIAVFEGAVQVRTAYRFAPVHTLSDTFIRQTAVFKSEVPEGSTVLFLSERRLPWQVGLWQRALYRQYNVLEIVAESPKMPAIISRMQREHAVHYVLCAVTPPPVRFTQVDQIPPQPGAAPLILGKLD